MAKREEQLKRLIAAVTPPDETARARAKEQWDSLAKPLSSLGLLEDAVTKLAALQETSCVQVSSPRLAVFCADNGVVARGVTQCGSEVTAKVAVALAENRSSVSPLAAAAECPVIPVDMGMLDFGGHPGVRNLRIRNGTGDISCGPAMSREECLRAMLSGAELARELTEKGTDLLLVGEMGIGNTTTAAAVTAVLLELPPGQVVGRGAGLSDEGLERKREALRRALRLNCPDPRDPVDVLAKVGGLDLAAMCGAYLGAAACRTGVLLDGIVGIVAALCACRLCPAAGKALLASHVSAEPAAPRILEAVGLEAPLHARLCLGEGSGAVLMLELLKMALGLYRSGQSFTRLGIEPYMPQTEEKTC